MIQKRLAILANSSYRGFKNTFFGGLLRFNQLITSLESPKTCIFCTPLERANNMTNFKIIILAQLFVLLPIPTQIWSKQNKKMDNTSSTSHTQLTMRSSVEICPTTRLVNKFFDYNSHMLLTCVLWKLIKDTQDFCGIYLWGYIDVSENILNPSKPFSPYHKKRKSLVICECRIVKPIPKSFLYAQYSNKIVCPLLVR